MAKRTVVLGKGSLAIKICEWFAATDDHDLFAVVPVFPEPDWTGSIATWARERGLCVESGDWRDVEGDVDLAFSCFYDRIVPASFIDRCGRILNLHLAPLPKYRGMRPVNWALKNGEREHGVTIHEIAPGVDDGAIVSQVKVTIWPEVEEVRDVYHRLLDYAWLLFRDTMPLLDLIEPVSQIEAEATIHFSSEDELLGDRRGWARERDRRP